MTGRAVPMVDRLSRYVRATSSGCWEWTGARHESGYGRLSLNGGTVYAHRMVWMIVVGPIPDRMQLDHLCRNPPCCNPAHLEVVTPRENVMRGESPGVLIARTGLCGRGHELTPGNVYYRKDRPGAWNCNACKRELRQMQRAA